MAVTTTTMGVDVGPRVGDAAGVSVGAGDWVAVAPTVTVGLAVGVGEGDAVKVAEGAASVASCVSVGVEAANSPSSPPGLNIVPPARIKPTQQITAKAKAPIPRTR